MCVPGPVAASTGCRCLCSAARGDLGRVANPRPVATIKKWATGRVMQRQVLTRTVGHGETGFLLRSIDLDRSSGNGVRAYETGLGFATRPRYLRPTRKEHAHAHAY